MNTGELYMDVIGQFINGEIIRSTESRQFAKIDPSTGSEVAFVQEALESQIDSAISAAKIAQVKWALTPPAQRSTILLKAADLIELHNDELAQLETLDTGKPIFDTQRVDIAGGVSVIRYCASILMALDGEQIPVTGSMFAYTKREPLGVIAGIGAWNYPTQIAMWKLAPALAAGCAMVFKPSEVTPLGAMRLAEILVEAGLPRGLFNVVNGGAKVGRYLCEHPSIAKISFTGSIPTGKSVMALGASSSLKKITLELGGKSPLIIWSDADLSKAAEIAMMANFFSSGQVCTSGTRVFVHKSQQDSFIEKIKERVRNIKIGDPKNPITRFGPLVSQEQLERVMAFVASGKNEGARVVCGGERMQLEGFEKGYYMEPTVFSDCHDQMRIVKEEIFGPVMSILTYESETELIARANNTEFGLAAGVVTQNLNVAHRLAASIESGIFWINTWGQVPPQLPVSGQKQSGYGQENGIDALREFTKLKSVLIQTGEFTSTFA